jgi:hypothetical protein
MIDPSGSPRDEMAYPLSGLPGSQLRQHFCSQCEARFGDETSRIPSLILTEGLDINRRASVAQEVFDGGNSSVPASWVIEVHLRGRLGQLVGFTAFSNCHQVFDHSDLLV